MVLVLIAWLMSALGQKRTLNRLRQMSAITSSARHHPLWNPGAERMFGYARQEALERSLDLIIPERLRRRHWDGYNRVMQTGHSRYADGDLLSVPAIRKDGSTISVEFTVTPIKDETGELIGMAAVMRDATKQFQEMRALKRKLDER